MPLAQAADAALAASGQRIVLIEHGGALSDETITLMVEKDIPIVTTFSPLLLQAQPPHWFDLLCTDAVMPGMSGPQLAEHYVHRHPRGKVLVCSGYVRSTGLWQALDAGHYGFLAKPFTPVELSSTVRAMLDGESSVGERAPGSS